METVCNLKRAPLGFGGGFELRARCESQHAQIHNLFCFEEWAESCAKNLDVTYRVLHNYCLCNILGLIHRHPIVLIHGPISKIIMAGKHPDNYCPVFGNYPKEYNRAVHGTYQPWVNYGPKDTPFGDVKLGEFKTWFARRQKTPAAAVAVASRWFHNFDRRWLDTKYGSMSKGFFQVIVMSCTMSLLLSYGYYKAERNHKYHW